MSSAGADETLSLAQGCDYRQAILPPVTQNLTIDGYGATLKDGSGFTVTAGTLTVNGLDFRRARIMVTRIGALAVRGGTFTGDSTSGNGGAIDVEAPAAGGLSVTGARFTGNSAGGGGGAIFAYNHDGMYITGSTFTGNRSAAGGGAILSNPDFQSILSGDVIRGNIAPYGGGIMNDSGLDVAGSRISGNIAAVQGGGLWSGASGDVPVTVTGTVIRGNVAGSGGGGIYNAVPSVPVTVTNSPVTGNWPDNCEPPGSVTGCMG